ncbi:MAG TPA: hypothetical protein VLV49_08605 [Terriglobales bacterium]|nr:hypothetical protein [Terriglobales bacterium]
MKRISTPYTFSLRVFPFIFVGFCAVFVSFLLVNGAWEKNRPMVVIPCVMAILGWYFARANLRDLVDEVEDCGEYLLVRKNGEEDTVLLSNIANVNFNPKPPRITLTLASPGKFGTQISFAPPPQMYLSAVPHNKIADDLIARTTKARAASAR